MLKLLSLSREFFSDPPKTLVAVQRLLKSGTIAYAYLRMDPPSLTISPTRGRRTLGRIIEIIGDIVRIQVESPYTVPFPVEGLCHDFDPAQDPARILCSNTRPRSFEADVTQGDSFSRNPDHITCPACIELRRGKELAAL